MTRQSEARAAAEALEEAAYEIQAELICCDAYEQGDPDHPHQICYWAGAAHALVKDREDSYWFRSAGAARQPERGHNE